MARAAPYPELNVVHSVKRREQEITVQIFTFIWHLLSHIDRCVSMEECTRIIEGLNERAQHVDILSW
jgi:hypothetical protein